MMTIDEAMEKAATHIDTILEQCLEDAEIMFVDHGGAPEDIESALKHYAATLAAERELRLAELRAWLERGGETQH